MMKTTDFPRFHLKHLFLTGKVPVLALGSSPEFCYSLYVPEEFYMPTVDAPKIPLVVAVHGSRREFQTTRDNLRPLADAEESACAILAPLFPADMNDPHGLDRYKKIWSLFKRQDGSICNYRYDEILLDMVREVGLRYPGIDTSSFAILGYSGGGQFTHRFLYLHSDHIWAASIGAPGGVSLLETTIEDVPCHANDANPSGTYGPLKLSDIDIASLKRAKLQVVVGDQDLETKQFQIAAEIAEEFKKQQQQDSTEEQALSSGLRDRRDIRTRVEKAGSLHQNWLEHGLDVRLDIVPGVAHESTKCNDTVMTFLREQLISYHSRQNS